MTILIALASALIGSLAVEAWDGADRRPIGRRPAELALRLAGYALLTVFWFCFSWRPWLAAFSCLLTVTILVVVSRLKQAVIGEPLVFSDFALLRQVPRHPDLYYTRPLTDPRMAIPLGTSLALVALWYWIEPTALPEEPSVALVALIGLPCLLVGLASALSTGNLAPWLAARFPRPDLDAHCARYGLPATIIAYALRWRSEPLPVETGDDVSLGRSSPAPVVVVVQLESFIDPTRLGGPALPLMETIRTRASRHGRLTVPAHGAYTMRTEHAVLTGREPESLGFGRYDPYLSNGGDEPASIARRAVAAGYATVFVHPFHRDFFHRAEVMRRFGFARLVMEEDFAGAPRIGPYIGDEALAARILAEVEAAPTPVLVFAVTMENHGPWKPGRLDGIDDPLAQYLHHVSHTGRAMETLIAGLEGRDAILCVYGDHAPSLPTCRPGFGDTATEYAVFGFGTFRDDPHRTDAAAYELGRFLRSVVAGCSVELPRSAIGSPSC
ncbi:LTA synthase family protein [Methylobacterium sp. 10]|uniref:LTA synthase family protein n=1 Tax=Methylobacterium sp. 10 TaxID=1101191 RepID=UPI0004B32D8C|nr:LTA synthase family protein [Methylobacterium sp. 10]